MTEKSTEFDGKTILKSCFYKNKKLFKIDDINAEKILFTEKEPYGPNKSIKCLIGCNDDDIIGPLYV